MSRHRPTDNIWQTPEQHATTRVLLHACCAPCSGAIVEAMLAHGLHPTLFYCNPNIYPEAEYQRRRDEASRYAATMGIDFVEDCYDHAAWRKAVEGLEHEPERGNRCLECFSMRLRRAALYAASHGFGLVATTLASSRWKSLEQIGIAGARAVDGIPGVVFWQANWRRGGLQERRNAIIREQNFYNQLYCGCEFSMAHLNENDDKE